MTVTIKKLENKKLSSNKNYDNHVGVWFFSDPEINLKGFIAIHRYHNIPSLGGTRFYPYKNNKEALSDALRLSRAMSYKCAISNLSHGGGKAVIIGKPEILKTKQLLRSYAKVVNSLNGLFCTGEDVGIEKKDVQYMLRYGKYFIGKDGQAEDPSPYAAQSVFELLCTAIKKELPKKKISDIRIAIKGLGKVGSALAEKLIDRGFIVIGADVLPSVTKKLKKKYPQMTFVSPEVIAYQEVDVYAPCALGNEFNSKMISRIKAKIICGSANNQLCSPDVATIMEKKRILFVPDYLANAGGLINVADELNNKGYNNTRVIANIHRLKKIFNLLYNKSVKSGQSMYTIAEHEMAKKVSR